MHLATNPDINAVKTTSDHKSCWCMKNVDSVTPSSTKRIYPLVSQGGRWSEAKDAQSYCMRGGDGERGRQFHFYVAKFLRPYA